MFLPIVNTVSTSKEQTARIRNHNHRTVDASVPTMELKALTIVFVVVMICDDVVQSAEQQRPSQQLPQSSSQPRQIKKEVSVGGGEATIAPQPALTGRAVKRRIAKMDGDIIIGALFPVHRQPTAGNAFTRQCGAIWEQYGIHRIETLDKINRNPLILPNVTLGCDIRDSCWYPPVALEQSIDFIKNSIANVDKFNSTGGPCTQRREQPIAGLIGPASSQVTVQVQNLLSIFNIPQIGYSATSKDLSDKSLNAYFLRVCPSDKLQARALVDLALRYNWTYVSTMYTEGNYGMRGMMEFITMARDAKMCVATAEKISNNESNNSTYYDVIIDNFLKTKDARVIICFCEGETVRGLISATIRKNVSGQFLIVSSDGWGVRPDVVDKIEEHAVGGISMKLYSPPLADFDQHYFQLRPQTNKRNPWFREFWQEKFRCYIDDPEEKDDRFNTPCTGGEDLRQDFIPDSKLGFVVNAIYAMAHALDRMHRDLCNDTNGEKLCDVMSPVNGTVFRDYLFNASFYSYSNDWIEFDRHGDPPSRYDIMNFQKFTFENGSTYYDYVRIGGWMDGELTLHDELVMWPAGLRPLVTSVCSNPCSNGQFKQMQGSVHCCWVCTQCKDYEILLDEFTCEECPMGQWPNKNQTKCIKSEIEYLKWTDVEAMVAVSFACLGILTTMWVTFVFFRHNDTPVVKASTRELSYIILVGITVSYVTTFPLVVKPTWLSCSATRILPGLSFSLIYGALVTKTNRIARILAGSKKKIMTRKLRFMSASAQVVITGLIVATECVFIGVMWIIHPPNSKFQHPIRSRVRLICNDTMASIAVPLGFDILLIILCTLYAIKTRNLPENFNEAKFIGFTMYTTCIIWLAFVPIYFGSDNNVITMCLAISFSATVALVLLFLPKVYIILYRPEKNNRSAFTTTRDVRCHIGTGVRQLSFSTSGESMDSSRKVTGSLSSRQSRGTRGGGVITVIDPMSTTHRSVNSNDAGITTLSKAKTGRSWKRNLSNLWKTNNHQAVVQSEILSGEDISGGHQSGDNSAYVERQAELQIDHYKNFLIENGEDNQGLTLKKSFVTQCSILSPDRDSLKHDRLDEFAAIADIEHGRFVRDSYVQTDDTLVDNWMYQRSVTEERRIGCRRRTKNSVTSEAETSYYSPGQRLGDEIYPCRKRSVGSLDSGLTLCTRSLVLPVGMKVTNHANALDKRRHRIAEFCSQELTVDTDIPLSDVPVSKYALPVLPAPPQTKQFENEEAATNKHSCSDISAHDDGQFENMTNYFDVRNVDHCALFRFVDRDNGHELKRSNAVAPTDLDASDLPPPPAYSTVAEMPLTPASSESSVSQFQQLLSARGLVIDITTVQSSDV